MIPQIKEINFPSYATLHQATISLTEMGERTISTQVRIDGSIAPEFGVWRDGVFHPMELEFKGERFILPARNPQASKSNESINSLCDLTFYSWPINELQRYYYVQTATIGAGTVVADNYVVPLALNLQSLVQNFNSVLDYYFHGKIIMTLSGSVPEEVVPIEINYTRIWDVLVKIYELYETRWRITYDSTNDRYVIEVGYTPDEIEDHDFEYGYKGGLSKFERQVQDYDISNILLGRGGEKNLPYRYFKEQDPNNPGWAADPDAIPELANIYFDRLRDKNFRNYVQGWRTNPRGMAGAVDVYDPERATTDWAYEKGHTDNTFNPVEYVKDDDSIRDYGERWGAVEDNDDIHPTIQGITRDGIGRVDEVVAVSEIVTDDVEATAERNSVEVNIEGKTTVTVMMQKHTDVTVEINGGEFTVPEGQSGNLWWDWICHAPRLTDDSSLLRIDTTTSSVTAIDVSTGDDCGSKGLPAGRYKVLITAHAYNDGTKAYNVTMGVGALKVSLSDADAEAWKPTFDIWIKNIWGTSKTSGETDAEYAERVWAPILGDRVGNEAKVVFSTGFLSISEDYEFVIADYPVMDRTKSIGGVASEWRITLRKSDAEYDTTGLFIPNATAGGQAAAGDKFFFTGIDMPHQYVVWAEEDLTSFKEHELTDSARINPTWVVTLDKVRVHTIEEGDYNMALADRLASGAILNIKDSRFTGGEAIPLFVQTITYTWNEPSEGGPYLVPDIEIVLSDKVLATEGTISKLEGDVRNIRNTYVRASDVETVVRRVASPLFLKKNGEAEVSNSPTAFAGEVSSTDFQQGGVGGQGWGQYRDGAGRSVLEVDKVVVRDELQVNSLVAHQIAYVGGKQIISAASMDCVQVDRTEEDDGFICYFDQKQGSIANLFKVGDIAMGQVFDEKNGETRFYKRLVTEVGLDYIVLADEDAVGDGHPAVGDTIVQFGNVSDPARQYVIVRDVIGGGYEQMLCDMNSLASDGTEYYFAGMSLQSAQVFITLAESGGDDLEDSNNLLLGYEKPVGKPRWFVGDAQGEYAEWVDGNLTVKGNIIVKKSDGAYSPLDYIADALEEDQTVTSVSGGMVLSTIIGVQRSGNLVAALNSSTLGYDSSQGGHGTLMIFAGATDYTDVATAAFRVYEDGHVVARDASIHGRIEAEEGFFGDLWIDDFGVAFPTRNGYSTSMTYQGIGSHYTDPSTQQKIGGGIGRSLVTYLGLYAGIHATGDIGLWANGDTYSIFSETGMFAGLRPNTRAVGASSSSNPHQLSNIDYTIIVTDDCYINLPADPENGQTFFIVIYSTYNITINGNGKQIHRIGESGTSGTKSHSNFQGFDLLVFNGTIWIMSPASAV